MQFEKQI